MAYCKPYKKSYRNNQHLVEQIVPGPIEEDLVNATEQERRYVTEMFTRTLHVQLVDVKKVKNSFLEAMYLLKKEEYKNRYSYVNEMCLIHITADSNVQSIICNNFDWRRVSRGKFGLGTSFSADAQYANKYANLRIGCKRAAIITKVIISRTTIGRQDLVIPPEMWDTTVGNKGKVYVKFCDHELLPIYVATFYNTDRQPRINSMPGLNLAHASRSEMIVNNQNERFIRNVYEVDRQSRNRSASEVNIRYNSSNIQRTNRDIHQSVTGLHNNSRANQPATALPNYRDQRARAPVARSSDSSCTLL